METLGTRIGFIGNDSCRSSNIEQLVPQDANHRDLRYTAWLFQEQSALLVNHSRSWSFSCDDFGIMSQNIQLEGTSWSYIVGGAVGKPALKGGTEKGPASACEQISDSRHPSTLAFSQEGLCIVYGCGVCTGGRIMRLSWLVAALEVGFWDFCSRFSRGNGMNMV